MKMRPSKRQQRSNEVIDLSSGLLYCGKLTATIMEIHCLQRLALRTGVTLTKNSKKKQNYIRRQLFPNGALPTYSVLVRPMAAYFEPTETRDTKPAQACQHGKKDSGEKVLLKEALLIVFRADV